MIDFKFNFEKGEYEINPSGAPVEISELDALKQWIEYKLRYSVDIVGLLAGHLPRDYVKLELKRVVTDALTQHSEINSVSDVYVRDNVITVKVNTIYGNAEVTSDD